MAVSVLKCALFTETLQQHNSPRILKALGEFIKTKMADPIAPYGSSDKSNPSSTPMAIEVPKIRHAHLTSDVSIFYTISGSNPTQLKLFSVLSHDESGTGQPVNVKKQKSIAKKMSNQSFT